MSKILTKNYLDSNSTVTLSHGGSSGTLYSWDPDDGYSSVNGNRDAVSVSVEITFRDDNGDETNRLIDHLIVLSNNFCDWKFEVYNSTNLNFEVIHTATDNVNGTICLNFGSRTTSRVRISCTRTMLPNREKKIGLLYVGKHLYSISGPSQYSVTSRQSQVRHELIDGSLHCAVVKVGTYKTQKYRARVKWQSENDATKTCLEKAKNRQDAFVWWPFPDDRPNDIFYVHWTTPFTANPGFQYVGSGMLWDIDAEFEEV